jgi:diguanylate cyclase (GGDEF)-like protein
LEYFQIDMHTLFVIQNLTSFIILIMLFVYGVSAQFEGLYKYYLLSKLLLFASSFLISFNPPSGNPKDIISVMISVLQFAGIFFENYCIIFIGKKANRKFTLIFFSLCISFIALFIILSFIRDFFGFVRFMPSLFAMSLLLISGIALLFFNINTLLRKFSGIFFILMIFPHFLVLFNTFDFRTKDFVFFIFIFLQMILGTMTYLLMHRETTYLELKDAATKDFLTGIFNRREFMTLSTMILNIMIRQKKPVSILMLDLDNFKVINDTYGHHVGDNTIKHFARTVEKLIRKQDIFGRYGGEEFMVLLTDTSKETAQIIAERIRSGVENSTAGLLIPRYTVSIGISSAVPVNTMELENLIKAADDAMYKAKKNGRNKVMAYFENCNSHIF